MKRLFAGATLAAALQLLYSGPASAQPTPYLGEIRLFAFNFCPIGWAFANGQLLSINQNQALFTLLGTLYGGDGQTTFALPNLSGRAPYGASSGQLIGSSYGASSVTLTTGSKPLLATAGGQLLTTSRNHEKIEETGGKESVAIQSPALALTWCIALTGVFPTQN